MEELFALVGGLGARMELHHLCSADLFLQPLLEMQYLYSVSMALQVGLFFDLQAWPSVDTGEVAVGQQLEWQHFAVHFE